MSSNSPEILSKILTDALSFFDVFLTLCFVSFPWPSLLSFSWPFRHANLLRHWLTALRRVSTPLHPILGESEQILSKPLWNYGLPGRRNRIIISRIVQNPRGRRYVARPAGVLDRIWIELGGPPHSGITFYRYFPVKWRFSSLK